MKFYFLLFSLCLGVNAFATNINPLKAPVWSDSDRYQSRISQTIPFRDKKYIAFAGLNYGFKNGIGLDGGACKKLSRYLCAGARLFLGVLNSHSLVRGPTILEVSASSSEVHDIVASANANWFAIIPEIGFTVNTQIIPLSDDLWSESAWFGFGKAFIGGFGGWAVSFEPGISKKFAADSEFGWTARLKYSFGWLSPDNKTAGTIPYDWANITGGVFYAW